jgi:hypothetical protein
MNIQQMHIGVKLGIDRVDSNLIEDLLPQEIDYYLNEAINEYIKQQYSIIKDESKSLESQYAIDNLRTILVSAIITHTTSSTNNASFTVPSDFYYYISGRLISNGTTKTLTNISSKAIKLYIETEFNKPLFREYPLIFEGNLMLVISDARDDITTSQLNLTYIKKPAVVELSSTDCNLPEHTHFDIVRLTVNKILADINQGQQ